MTDEPKPADVPPVPYEKCPACGWKFAVFIDGQFCAGFEFCAFCGQELYGEEGDDDATVPQ